MVIIQLESKSSAGSNSQWDLTKKGSLGDSFLLAQELSAPGQGMHIKLSVNHTFFTAAAFSSWELQQVVCPSGQIFRLEKSWNSDNLTRGPLRTTTILLLSTHN
jgi:hypothetical protein